MRPLLSLYTLDRPALIELSKELKRLLIADDRPGIAALLALGGGLAERIATGTRAVDWFLRPESDTEAAPLFASLRRVSKKRALSLAWTSKAPSLEGRLRGYDLLREDREVAALIDKLLDPGRLPWFLVRPGSTCGWLDDAKRTELDRHLRALRAALSPSFSELATAIHEMDGAVVAHDML